MRKNTINDYKTQILELLDKTPSGLTITELTEKTGAHRNTISTHIRSLEAEEKVVKKEIGSAHLYFSKKREYISKELVNSFLKALLASLKVEYPDDGKEFKKIGHEIIKRFQFPIGDAYIETFKQARSITDPKTQLKLFKDFYNSYDFFQDDLEISIQELTDFKAIFRITNSEYLDSSDEFLYFFYIACGITEGIYKQNLDKNVRCKVENVKYMPHKDKSYIEISLEILND